MNRRFFLKSILAGALGGVGAQGWAALAPPFRVAVASLSLDTQGPGRLQNNLAKLLGHVQGAQAAGAAVLLLPELALGGYSFDLMDPWWRTAVAQPDYWRAIRTLGVAARRCQVNVLFGAAAKLQGVFYNATWWAPARGPLKVVATKHNLPGADVFVPGDIHAPVAVAPGALIRSVICADVLQPALMAEFRMAPPQIAMVSSCWPDVPGYSDGGRDACCKELSQAAGFLLMSNYRGGGHTYRDLIACQGDIVWSATHDQDTLVLADLDLAQQRVLAITPWHRR